MSNPEQSPRERGRRLLTRINRWAIAGAIGLAGLFSFVAAETTHGKSTASTSLQQPSSTPTATTSSSGSSGSGNTGSANTGNSGNTGSTGNSGSSTGSSGSGSVVSGGS